MILPSIQFVDAEQFQSIRFTVLPNRALPTRCRSLGTGIQSVRSWVGSGVAVKSIAGCRLICSTRPYS
ncbi:MAG: hypothetical protein HC827_06345 [Cyanobacteria bacterium RM1_2_2]|nr:hypothetical protein [Cyanobacteria bacterium RM1_2_2]